MSLKLFCLRFTSHSYEDDLCLALEKAVKGSDGIILWNVQKVCECDVWGHGLVGNSVVLGYWWDFDIRGFFQVNDSMIQILSWGWFRNIFLCQGNLKYCITYNYVALVFLMNELN